MFTFEPAHLRQLKGTPLAALLAVALAAPQPVTADYVARLTGYTDKPITQALQYLADLQYITRARNGWMLAEALQLALPAPVDNSVETRNFSDSPSRSDDDAAYLTSELIKSSSSSDSEKFRIQQNESELRRIGITLNARTRQIISLPHVTPDYIIAHVKAAEANSKLDNPRGFALTQIAAGEPVPRDFTPVRPIITDYFPAELDPDDPGEMLPPVWQIETTCPHCGNTHSDEWPAETFDGSSRATFCEPYRRHAFLLIRPNQPPAIPQA